MPPNYANGCGPPNQQLPSAENTADFLNTASTQMLFAGGLSAFGGAEPVAAALVALGVLSKGLELAIRPYDPALATLEVLGKTGTELLPPIMRAPYGLGVDLLLEKLRHQREESARHQNACQ